MKLRPVPIEQFVREWPFYHECLRDLKRLRGGTWIPEHVFAEVLNNTAHVYAAPEGFVIFKGIRDDYSYDRKLLVWLAYGDQNHDLIDKYQEDVMELGRDHGYVAVQFYRAPKHPERETTGWRRMYSIYELPLTEE